METVVGNTILDLHSRRQNVIENDLTAKKK